MDLLASSFLYTSLNCKPKYRYEASFGPANSRHEDAPISSIGSQGISARMGLNKHTDTMSLK